MNSGIRIENIEKSFGNTSVLKGVNLDEIGRAHV